MATIGQFKPVKNGYEGTISTMTIARKVRFVANDNKKNEDSPDYFIKTGQCDLGVAWHAESEGDTPRKYIKVLLDDPSFAAPVNGALFEHDGNADLVWSRPNRERKSN